MLLKVIRQQNRCDKKDPECSVGNLVTRAADSSSFSPPFLNKRTLFATVFLQFSPNCTICNNALWMSHTWKSFESKAQLQTHRAHTHTPLHVRQQIFFSDKCVIPTPTAHWTSTRDKMQLQQKTMQFTLLSHSHFTTPPPPIPPLPLQTLLPTSERNTVITTGHPPLRGGETNQSSRTARNNRDLLAPPHTHTYTVTYLHAKHTHAEGTGRLRQRQAKEPFQGTIDRTTHSLTRREQEENVPTRRARMQCECTYGCVCVRQQ